MAKITIDKKKERGVISVKTMTDKSKKATQAHKWWLAGSKAALRDQVLETVGFLKEQQMFRYRQAAIFARLYGNMPLFNWVGSNLNKLGSTNQSLPIDRPTMNVVQSCVDTLTSRITQNKPRPVFLTDNADYKERNLAKQLNNFVNGELYQTKAYELGALQIRDAAVLGTGCIKIFETADHRVALERTLPTELLVDPNDAIYGDPRQLFQVKLVDRSVLAEMLPDYKSDIAKAEAAFPDNSADSQKTISDQIIVAEAWHLPSGKEARDGRHVIVCTAGVILDEDYKKSRFPFSFLHYSPRIMGFWGQGLAEQLMGTQVEINKLLMTISNSINLVGVPRVFVEEGSKVVSAHLNNQVGAIVKFRGTKPIYEVAPCVPQELYGQLERLVQYAYQQSGISALAAAAQKPAGLNSGEAIRNYDDLQSDRFAALEKRYTDVYIDLAYQITDLAKDIAEREGKYSTVYPNKDGTKEIDLPNAKLIENPVIQCFSASSLPRDPAGRLAKVTELMQGGLISPQEGRRLLDYPDIEQVDKLENAVEERILQALDDIVESGTYTPPDPYMLAQPGLATKLVTQYYNLYVPAKLEENKAQLLRNFFLAVQNLEQAAMAPPAPAPGMMPTDAGVQQAVPTAAPVSELLPNIPV
jgi:hypothetical protein